MQKQQKIGRMKDALIRAKTFLFRKRYVPTQSSWHRILNNGHLVKISGTEKSLSVKLIGINAISLVTYVAQEAVEVKKHMQSQFGKVESVLDNDHRLKSLHFFYQPVDLETRLRYELGHTEYFCSCFAADKSGKSWGPLDAKYLEPTNISDTISQIDAIKASSKNNL
jgi:hypothetical protein